MSSINTCRRYGPGHTVHWIQAFKSLEPDQPRLAVKVVAVQDDGRLELEGDDGLRLTRWTHDPMRLRNVLGRGGQVQWRPRFYVLSVGGSVFNLARLDQLTPCAPQSGSEPAGSETHQHQRSDGGEA